MTSEEGNAPGWDAIDSALSKVYPGQEPLHYAPDHPPMLGGSYPFQGVSLYQNEVGRPHWHAVTYGLTELFGKDSPDPEFSGYGFELTVRIPRVEGEDAMTVVDQVLVPLGQYVRQTGNPFAHGHRIKMNFKSKFPNTKLRALVFCLDPELGSIKSVHGRVDFLQIVGITEDELEHIREASSKPESSDCLLQILKKDNPMLVMDFERGSILNDEELRNELESNLRGLE